MIRSALAVSILLVSVSGGAGAADPGAGQTLHERHCVSCHESLMRGEPSTLYTRQDRRIASWSALLAQVQRCETSLGLQWSDADIENVAAFLDQRFYRFR